MKKIYFKRALSLCMAVLTIFIMLVPGVGVVSNALVLKQDTDICSALNTNIYDFAKTYVFWENTSKQNKSIVDGIKYGEKGVDICLDTATTLVFTLIPGYGGFKWVDWAFSRGVDVLELGIYHAIIGSAKTYIEIGNSYCNTAYDKFMKNKNSRGEITDPNIAYDIFTNYLIGFKYHQYGNGFYTKIMDAFIEERRNKAKYYTKSAIEVAINAAIKAASPSISKMFPKLKKLADKEIYEIGDLYGVLSSVEWADLLSNLKGHFNGFNIDLEKEIQMIKTGANNIYNNSFAKAKETLKMSYEASPYYETSQYKKALKNVCLTGDQREDLVKVAESQVGYHEGNNASQIGGTNIFGIGNYTEYGYWFGYYAMGKNAGHFYAWCAMFISWCARQANIPVSVISNAAYACADGSSKKGGYSYFHVDYYNRGSYTPRAGDLIFFGKWEHVGIVYKVANGRVYTIEGNNNNRVKKTSYSLTSTYIKCYGVPKYNSAGTANVSNGYTYNNGASIFPTGTYKITAKSGLNARSKPSANSKKLSGWSYGTTVSVTATDGNWGYTSRGWICLDYAQFISGPASSYDSNVSYGTGNYVVSTTAGLNCRRGAGTNFGVIKALPHGTNFSVTKTDGAWGYSPEYGGWLCLQYASYESALTPILPVPAMPKLSSSTSSEIGVGEVISLSWDAVDTADKYNVKLIEPSTAKVVKSLSVSGTSASVTVPYAGVFNISVLASNSQHTGEEAVLRGFWAYSPLTVTFKSWDGKVISKQSVAFGKDATLPKAPARTGYTFTEWSGNYKSIKEDTAITAKYIRNKYNVNFYDYDGSLLTTQSVYYGDNAVAPKYEAPTGYSFVKWNRSFNNITSETNVKAVISWTSLYPLEISTKSAVQRNNKSYIVTSIVNNSPNAVSNAKVIAVIKTKENKLLATVESKNISLAKGEVKNLTLSATYGGMATRAELFVVKADNEKIPLASQLSVKVDPGTAWTSWSTSTPPSDALASEKRTEYRYRDKEFKTSSSSSLSGWTKYNTTWVWGSYGSTQGPIYSNPGSSDSRKSWSEQYVSSYGTTKHYYYFRYANSSGSSGNDIKTGSYTNYQELDLTYKLTNRSSTTGGSGTKGWKVFYKSSNYNDSSTGNYRTYWYKSEADVTDYSKPINGTRWYYQDRSKVYTYHYYQWKKWSDWSTTAYTSNNDRQIETRTVYRYVENKSDNIETTGGQARTISGSVNQSYTNRQALLFIASKDGVSQFVGQTQIGANGSYSFAFKLKDEPSAASGDYTVMLGIEGTSAAFELNPIKAPVPEYKVKFVDHDGTVVSEQTVKQGENAAVPAPLNREGYRFIGWDKSFTNIQGNTTLTALYKIKTFEVVFVDELNNTTSTVKYNYADALVPPEVKTNDAYNFLGWDAVLEGKTKVTENMVVSAKFEKKVFNVKFLDFDGSVLNSQSIEYGEPVVIPELKDRDEYVFISWNIPADLNYVTKSMTVKPCYEYKHTVATPTASVETGTYNGQQKITLSCETKGAQIYYTTDGTVPNIQSTKFKAERTDYDLLPKSTGTKYTGPFTVDKSAKLTFVAIKDGMNSSMISSNLYAINSDTNKRNQHIVRIHNNITDNVTNLIVEEGSILPELDNELDDNGYDLVGVYKSDDYSATWNIDSDIITKDTDIYLQWKKETYSVKFLAFDGSVISEQNIQYLESAIAPNISNIKGYVFMYWDRAYTCVTEDITVSATYVPETAVTMISFDKKTLSLVEGQSATITAKVNLGKDCKNNAVIWQSSDENVAVVDDNGKITAVSGGSAMIYAVSEGSGMSAQCEVTVEYKDPCAELGHKYASKVTAPTCTIDGYTTHTCTVCFDSYKDSIVKALGHTDDNGDGKCDRCGEKVNKPSNPSSGCSCKCHKSGIAKFFFKIILFFQKIFKLNKICRCKAKHY